MKCCVLRSMGNTSAFKKMLAIILFMQVKCSTPASWQAAVSFEVYHSYFKECSLSFMTSVFTVLSVISLDKVPPLSILTFENL